MMQQQPPSTPRNQISNGRPATPEVPKKRRRVRNNNIIFAVGGGTSLLPAFNAAGRRNFVGEDFNYIPKDIEEASSNSEPGTPSSTPRT